MPTQNPRINITLKKQTLDLLTRLAAQEEKSVASLTKELVLEALDRREDMILSAVARVRDLEGMEREDHDNVWDD